MLPPLFCAHFHELSFSVPFLSVCAGFDLREPLGGSTRERLVWVSPGTPCLLIGAFVVFTLEVIVDRYAAVAILLFILFIFSLLREVL